MAEDKWQKVEPDTTPAWGAEEWKKEEQLEGVLVEIQSQVGPNNSKIYTIEKVGGERVKFWGSIVLDVRLNQIPLGSEIRIVYIGKETNPKTKREYYVFEVYRKS